MGFDGWTIAGAFTLGAAALLRNLFLEPEDAVEPFERVKVPTSEEGSPVPLVYGRVRMRSPNTLWWGNLDRDEVREGIYDHFVGIQLGLCLGCPLSNSWATLHKIWVGEKLFHSQVGGHTHSDAGVEFTESDTEFFGGRGEGGGFSARVFFYGGSFTQDVNSALSDSIGALSSPVPVPAYRGLAYVYLGDANIGETPQLQPLSFEIEVQPDALTYGAIGDDANPAEVIYDLIRSDWGRLGLPVERVDLASFQAAAATLATEVHGTSLIASNQGDAWSLIRTLLRQIDGLLYEEPTTGQLTLRLVRADYVASGLDVYDEDDIIEMQEFSVAQLQSTANQVRVTYTSRIDDYADRVAVAQNHASILEQGQIRTVDVTFRGISTSTLAQAVATRELQTLIQPLKRLRFRARRQAATLRPGDVIKVSWADYGVNELVCRVVSLDLGTLEDGDVAVTLVEDKFATNFSIWTPQDPQFDSDPVPNPTPTTTQRILELPRWWTLFGYNVSRFADPDDSILGYLVLAPHSNHTSFESQVSSDAGTSYATDRAAHVFGFTPTATLNGGYAIDTPEYDTSVGITLSNVSDVSVFANATESQIRSGAANLILIGDELLCFENFSLSAGGTIVTLTNVWRGVLDTSPRAHSNGATVWLWFASGINVAGDRVWRLGEQDLRARIIPNTGYGVLSEDTATVTSDIDIEERPDRAYPPDMLTIDGRTGHGAVFMYTTNMLTRAATLDLLWRSRSRLETTVTRADDNVEAQGDDSVDANPTRYVVRHQINGGGYTETTVAVLTTTLAVDEGDTVDLEVYGERNADANLRSLFPVLRTFDVIMTNKVNTLPGMGLVGAWGVRLMVGGYSGNLVRIRDTSDDTETNYGANEFGRLLQVTTTGEARVVTIYDQTGNGNDLTAPTTGAQPLLVQTVNGSHLDSVVDFDGSNDTLETASFLSTSGNALLTSASVGMWSGTWDGLSSNAGAFWALEGDSSVRYGLSARSGLLVLDHNGIEDSTSFVDPSNTNDELSFIASLGTGGRTVWQETADNAVIDRTSSTSITYSSGVDYQLRLGRRPGGSGYLAHGFHELSLYSAPSALTPDMRDAVLVDLFQGWWR